MEYVWDKQRDNWEETGNKDSEDTSIYRLNESCITGVMHNMCNKIDEE